MDRTIHNEQCSRTETNVANMDSQTLSHSNQPDEHQQFQQNPGIVQSLAVLCLIIHMIIKVPTQQPPLTPISVLKSNLTDPLGWRGCSLQLCQPLSDALCFFLRSLGTQWWVIDLNDDYHLEFGQKVNSTIESKTSLDGDEGTKGAGSVAIDSSTGSRSGAFVKWGEAERTCTSNMGFWKYFKHYWAQQESFLNL